MSEKTVVVSNISDVYKNPQAELIQEACKYDSRILLVNGTVSANAKSIMGLMAFGLHQGMSVGISASGADESAALSAMEKFLTCR